MKQEERNLKMQQNLQQSNQLKTQPRKNKKTVLLIDECHKVLQENLEDKGFIVDFHPEYNRDDLIKHLPSYDALVVRSKIDIDKEIIDRGENLKCIARSGAGMDSIDVTYAESKCIQCLNSPEGNRDAVGEHALGLLLALFNKIASADKEVRQGIWLREENRGLEIKGKTIGIIGYGNMGNAFAQRLSGFDCKVLAYDKYKENYGNSFASQASLEDLFEQADVLSLHVPLTPETKYMVNKEFINKFQKSIYLINTSRGKVVKLQDLISEIKSNKILGAGLDVLEYESMSLGRLTPQNEQAEKELNDLFSLKNTVLSPHVAGWTIESYYKLAFYLSEKIADCLNKA